MRQDDAGCERDDGVDEERERRDAGCVFPDLIHIFFGEVGVLVEDRVDVKLADIGGCVEEEGEPCEPRRDLNQVDPSDSA